MISRFIYSSSLFIVCAAFFQLALSGESKASKALQEEPITKTVLAVIKDKKPLILADILPEVEKLRAFSEDERSEYVYKRALMLLESRKNAKKDFKTHETFTVRLILLKDKDEYGKPQWGSAPEVAFLTIQRSEFDTLSVDDIVNLSADSVKKLFVDAKISIHEFDSVVE